MERAVILLSGGLDSATVLALARERGYDCYALSFRYGQRHAVELEAAGRVARTLGATLHRTAEVDLRWIGGSALTADLAVPKDRPVEAMGDGEIPVTYVPARNALFLCYALAWAEVLGARDLFAGMNALDYSGYPDCRPEFLAAFQTMARLGTRAGVGGAEITVHAPLIRMTKAEIIREGIRLGVDYAITHSCYDPASDGGACGRCDSCALRKKGFRDADVSDPTRYQGA
ncbi:MAG: 7-cyano-7-deazaguanine synthase QueC [Myxococcales bacterium]|nr:7-cyano-7-deazaguanine synthase QueC [Myxococcales bacterium]